jgi:hypothetical protein
MCGMVREGEGAGCSGEEEEALGGMVRRRRLSVC